MTTCSDAGREEPLGGGPRLVAVRATSQSGTGRPWATSSDFASASWIFTRRGLRGTGHGEAAGSAMVPRRRPDGR